MSICDKLEKYTKRYNSHRHKTDKIEEEINPDNFNEKEETQETKEDINEKELEKNNEDYR